MGKALQVVSGFVTAPSTTFTTWTMGAGDSLSVRNSPEGSAIQLLSFWADNQAAGQLRIRSALLHDNVEGMTGTVVASTVQPLIHWGQGQRLRPQDLLIVEQTGSAVAGDIESGSFLVYYENLPGADAHLVHYRDIVNRIESYMYVNNTLSLGTAGGYSGEEAINAEDDQWKANRDYALLGYLVSAECCTVGWRGPGTGNLRVAGPGCDDNKMLTANWFRFLNEYSGYPTIPVINAADKAATLIDGVQDENGTDVTVTSIFALLR